MRLRYSPTGARQLAEVLRYIEERSPQGARRVLRRVQQMEAVIGTFPESGKAIGFGLRQIATPPYPHIIFFEVTEDEIIIHRHSARKPLEDA